MYKSPIELLRGEMQTAISDEIFKAVQKVGVVVNKDELVKALAFDRGQYQKGYVDGIKELLSAIGGGEYKGIRAEPAPTTTVFSEEDKEVYQPSNDLIYKRDAIQAIAEYEMYSAEMEYPGTASDDIEEWKQLGELILGCVKAVEPMPRYIDNVLIARHYCNGMVAMNEQCYQRLQKCKEKEIEHEERPELHE